LTPRIARIILNSLMGLSFKRLRLFDRLGFSASTLCAIHCAAMPFLVSVLPALGLGFLGGGAFELAMIAVSIIIATFSLGSSYRLHGRLNALMVMTSGAMLLVFNFFGHETHSELVETLHPYIAAFAGMMIASAHWINMRLCRSCEVCEHEHDHADHDHTHTHSPAAPEHSETHVHADGTYCAEDHEGDKGVKHPSTDRLNAQ
jgi:MerC mercury resistance protein